MKEKKKEMQKQVLTLLGILIFAFVNVFIFDNKMGAGFFCLLNYHPDEYWTLV